MNGKLVFLNVEKCNAKNSPIYLIQMVNDTESNKNRYVNRTGFRNDNFTVMLPTMFKRLIASSQVSSNPRILYRRLRTARTCTLKNVASCGNYLGEEKRRVLRRNTILMKYRVPASCVTREYGTGGSVVIFHCVDSFEYGYEYKNA